VGVTRGGSILTIKVLEILYETPLCGACDVGCKRNLELGNGLTLKPRIRPLKRARVLCRAHKKIAKNIADSHIFSVHLTGSNKWLPNKIGPSTKADVLYFVGCSAS